MAGWLGANFTTQLDQLKKGVSQVSNIVKDTLVVDETWDREEGPVDSHEKINDTLLSNPDANTEAGRLKELYKQAVKEKEVQCQSFRELLLEKENEIQELSKVLEEREESTTSMVQELSILMSSSGLSNDGEIDFENLLSILKKRLKEEPLNENVNSSSYKTILQLEEEVRLLSTECQQLTQKLSQVEEKDCVQSDELLNKTSNECIQLQEQLTEGKDQLLSVKQELQLCQKEKEEALVQISANSTIHEAEKTELLQNLSSKDEVIEALTKEKAVVIEELNIAKTEISTVQIALKERSCKSDLDMETLKRLHDDQIEKLQQEKANEEILTNQIEEQKAELAVLKVTEQELLENIAEFKRKLENAIKEKDELSKKLESNDGQSSDLVQKLSNALKEKGDVISSLQSVKEKLNESESNLERIRRENDDLSAQLQDQKLHEKSMQETESQLKLSEENVITLQEKLINAENSCKELNLELNQLKETSNQSEQNLLLDSNRNLEEIKNELASSLACNQSLVNQIEMSKLKYEQQIRESDEELEYLKNEFENLKNKYDSSEKCRKELQTQIECYSDYEDLKSKVAYIEGTTNENLNKIANLEIENEQLRKNTANAVEEITEEKKYLQLKLSDSEIKVKDLESKIEIISKKNGIQEDLVKEYQSKVAASETEIEELRNSAASSADKATEDKRGLQLKMSELEAYVTSLESKIEESISTNDCLSKEYESNLAIENEKYNSLKSQFNVLEDESKKLRLQQDNMYESDTKILELKEQLGSKENELAKLYETHADNVKSKEQLYLDLSKAQEVINDMQFKFDSDSSHNRKLYLDLQGKLDFSEGKCDELLKEINECRNQMKGFQQKIADYEDAIGNLKSINETISKSARDFEAENVELKRNTEMVQAEQLKVQDSLLSAQTKNSELSSQVESMSFQKLELENNLFETQKSITSLKEELNKLSTVQRKETEDDSDISSGEKNMLHVLNEKIRENTQMKSENNYLLQNLTMERESKEKLESELAECKQTYSTMNTESVKKLSLLVRDKDLEIESLSERNKTLLEIIEKEKAADADRAKIEASLKEELERLKSATSDVEIDNLKEANRALESKLSEILASDKNPSLKDVEKQNTDTSARSVAVELETKANQLESIQNQNQSLEQELSELKKVMTMKGDEYAALKTELTSCKSKETELLKEVERLNQQSFSLQEMLKDKSSSNESHQEQGLKYIAECERLTKDLSQMTSEKDNILTLSNARLQEAQDLRKEVSSIIEKKKRVECEVERLRGHLVQVEEGYTVELMEGEEREKELRKKVAQLEDQLRVATHTSSEASESASQASNQLSAALETAACQRDKLTDELATCQASLRAKTIELRNLQLALEGFQRQKENEIGMAERTCDERVSKEQRVTAELQEKLKLNKQQLDRAQQGLEAAARLSEQLDKKATVISNLKQEMSVREEMMKSMQEKILTISNSQVGRVDRDLVKNLVVGYVTADDSKKSEVLRIIATVLDFNGDERGRTGLEGGVGGWLGGLLGARSRHPSISQAPVDQSIAKAFIQFLEEESTPKTVVTLPVIEMAKNKVEQLASRSGKTPSPLLSSSPTLALPSLGSSSAHSPSILKSVLDEPVKEEN